jgi:haloalkane dehalogenase
MNLSSPITNEFPVESCYATVQGHSLHYIQAGTHNPPIVLLHGIPTHAYLWRNVLPHLAPQARTIAPDLIGFGKSAKPLDIDYTVETFADYFAGVLAALRVENFILVGMDVGLIVGLHYAMQHPTQIKGLVMFEGLFLPAKEMLRSQAFPARLIMRLFRIKTLAAHAIIRKGTMVDQMLTAGTIRQLSEEERNIYRAPLSDPAVRRKVWLEGIGPYTLQRSRALRTAIQTYTTKLAQSPIPKLLLYATPGAAVTAKTIAMAQATIMNLEVQAIGAGKHFLPEDQPAALGQAISAFYRRLNQTR